MHQFVFPTLTEIHEIILLIVGSCVLVLSIFLINKFIQARIQKKASLKRKKIRNISHAVQKLKEWQKHVSTGELHPLQLIVGYIYLHEIELQQQERDSVATDLLALWNMLPSMKASGLFYETLLKLTKRFPKIYADVFILGWHKHSEQDVKEAISHIKSFPHKDCKGNEWHATIESIVTTWIKFNPLQFPDWLRISLIELTRSGPFVGVIESLIQHAILAERDFEEIMNSTSALILLNDQDLFKSCLRLAIKRKYYSLYYPTIRKALEVIKKPWEGVKQEAVEQAIAIVTAVYEAGFYPQLKADIEEAYKKPKPETWQPSAQAWTLLGQEFIESGEYKRDEIRSMLQLFGTALIPAARALVAQEKKDLIIRRGALIYISEAMMFSDTNESKKPESIVFQNHFFKIKNLKKIIQKVPGIPFQKKKFTPHKNDFREMRLDPQNVGLMRSLCSENVQGEDYWCFQEAYATLAVIHKELYKPGKSTPKEAQLDFVVLTDVLFREHLRSIMQNLHKAQSLELGEERILISLHEPIEALRHFSSDVRITSLLKLMEDLDESDLNHIIHAIDECGIQQEKYPIPKSLDETLCLVRYWFLRRLLFENKRRDPAIIQWNLKHARTNNPGAQREIIGYLQSTAGTLFSSLRKTKNIIVLLVSSILITTFTSHSIGLGIPFASSIPAHTTTLISSKILTIQNTSETIALIFGKTELKTLFFMLCIISGIAIGVYVIIQRRQYELVKKGKKTSQKLTLEQSLSILETEQWVIKEGVDELVNTQVLEAITALSNIQPITYSEKVKHSIKVRLVGAWKKKDLLNLSEDIRKPLSTCKLFIETITDVVMSGCPGYTNAMKLGVNKTDLMNRAIDHLQKLSTMKSAAGERSALELAINHCVLRCRTKEYNEFDRNQLFYFVSKVGWQILMPALRAMIERECSAIKKELNDHGDLQLYTLRSGMVILFTTAILRIKDQNQHLENSKILQTILRTFSPLIVEYPLCFNEADRMLVLLHKREPSAETLINTLYHAIDTRLQNTSKQTFHEGEALINGAIEFLNEQHVLVSMQSMINRLTVKELNKLYLLYKESMSTLENLKKSDLFYWQNKAKLMISETILALFEQKNVESIAWFKTIPLFFAYDKLGQWAAQSLIEMNQNKQNQGSVPEQNSILNAIFSELQPHLDSHLKEFVHFMFQVHANQHQKDLLDEIQGVLTFLTIWKLITSLHSSTNATKILQSMWAHMPPEKITPLTTYFTHCIVGKQISSLLKLFSHKQAESLKLQRCCTVFSGNDAPLDLTNPEEFADSKQKILSIIGEEMFQYLITLFHEQELITDGKSSSAEIISFFQYLKFARNFLQLDLLQQEIISGILAHIPQKDLEKIFEYYAGLPLLKNIVMEFNEYRKPPHQTSTQNLLNIVAVANEI